MPADVLISLPDVVLQELDEVVSDAAGVLVVAGLPVEDDEDLIGEVVGDVTGGAGGALGLLGIEGEALLLAVVSIVTGGAGGALVLLEIEGEALLLTVVSIVTVEMVDSMVVVVTAEHGVEDDVRGLTGVIEGVLSQGLDLAGMGSMHDVSP